MTLKHRYRWNRKAERRKREGEKKRRREKGKTERESEKQRKRGREKHRSRKTEKERMTGWETDIKEEKDNNLINDFSNRHFSTSIFFDNVVGYIFDNVELSAYKIVSTFFDIDNVASNQCLNNPK